METKEPNTRKMNCKPLVFFDLETTGISVANDRIVQIAVFKQNIDGTQEEKCVLINPLMNIPKDASDVHGITNEMVKDSPTFKSISKSFYEFIKGCDLGGYNILGFDLPLLVEEFIRAGVEVDFSDCKFLDVMNIYKKLYPRNLSACYKHYTGKELENSHDALVDTKATVSIFQQMLLQEKELPQDFDELCSYSQYNENIVDFAGKFARNESNVICYNFGKNKGKPVSNDLGLLDWIIQKDFTKDTKQWARKLKNGEVI